MLVLPDDPQRERLSELACEIVTGDITKPASLAGALAGIHTIYHLAAVLLVEDPDLFRSVNVEGTRNVVVAAQGAGVEHLIHVSSASVVYPRTTHYSRSKREGEQIVGSAHELNATIVRPTLVYEGEGGLEFKIFSDYLRRCPVVPLIGDGRCLKTPVHAEDLIQGLASIAGNPLTYGREYNLCGGETVSLREMARLILKSQGRRRIFLPVPEVLCRGATRLIGALLRRPLLMEHTLAGLTQDADLDRTSAERDLKYHPRGVRQGLGSMSIR